MKFGLKPLLFCFGILSAVTLRAASGQMTTLSIAAGQSQAFALRSDGSLWVWGTNQVGEMGINGLASSSFPVRIPGLSGVIGISAGWQHSLAVEANGTVWAWGTNNAGQLGNGNNTSSPTPVQVNNITNAIAVAGGANHSLALLANGQVMAWGANDAYQLGNGTGTSMNQPILVSTLTNAIKIAAGAVHSAALDANGVMWCWGYSNNGQIGAGSGVSYSTIPIPILSNVVDIAVGAYHTLALKRDGTVWAWGNNSTGALGQGDTTDLHAPTMVPNLEGVSAIGAGFYTSAASLTNGQNLIWGFAKNSYVKVPTPLSPGEPFTKYAFGYPAGNLKFSLGVTANGSVWAWGANMNGQFGNGNIMAPSVGDLEFIPTKSFAATPPARWGEFLRGNTYDFDSSAHDLDFCSIVVPMDLEQGVALNATGSDSYCYSNVPPWFLSISNETLYLPTSLSTGTNLEIMPVSNPVAAFGSQAGGSSLYPNQPYRFGVYAGGFDESTPTATNAIRISVYNATDFTTGVSNVMPVNVFTIPLPRRTVAADSNLWVSFMANGGSITVATNDLTTTVKFLDNGLPDDKPFGLTWLNKQAITNFMLAGYEITHIATSTNFYYRVEVLGKVQVGNSVLAPMATNSAGLWKAAPLYTLGFSQLTPFQSVYMDRLFFNGTPMPPTYADATVVGPTGLNVMVTNQFNLTNSTTYTNLDTSPELRRHPILDQFVLDMNKDPLALASYVINQIELTDPYASGNGSSTVMPQVTCGGIDRSALGTFLEGQGSPVEQCALLVYLLRQAGYSAAYVFPTNNNLLMSASHISQLWEMQVNGVLYPNGIPAITNSFLTVNYPWVAANIGTNTIHIFPWLKDHEIVEGVNLYDYMPTNYNTSLQWVEQYVRADTNILNLDSENVVSKLFPAFVQQYLNPLGPSFSLDKLGVRTFNRQHQFPSWAYLPQPDAVTNLSTLSVVDNLSNNVTFSFLTNIFNTVRVQVYSNSVSGSLVLDTGNWDACDFDDRKFLLFTDNNRLALWLAPYRPDVTSAQSFAGPSSTALQSNSVPVGHLAQLAVQTIHLRQKTTLNSTYAILPMKESSGSTNLAHCSLGDVAAIALDFGRVTPLMLQQHEELYWGLQRQRATNSSFSPPIWDYSGTAAYLLGMGYFKKNDAFDVFNQQWHKVHSLINFSSGLGIIGATGRAKNIQAKVDMVNQLEFQIGNSSLHLNSGIPDFTAVRNYFNLSITAGSAAEHDIIQAMFPDQDAVSTVRLLQMAQQRATNGIPPIIEMFNNDYVAAGNNSYKGYGKKLLMNRDPNMWVSVSNVFNQQGGSYARVLITPGNITNAPKTYIGMGALIFGEVTQAALISANGASLNGAWGNFQPAFIATPVTQINLSWNLGMSKGGDPMFLINGTPTASTFAPTLSLLDITGLTANNFDIISPQQASQSLQYTLLKLGSGTTIDGLLSSANSGSIAAPDAGQRSFLQTVSEPVNVSSGEYYDDTVDLSLPGPFPLQLRRNYTSQNLQANEFGYGWKMNFNPYLAVASNIIYAAELDGTVIAYHSTNGVWKVLPQDNPTLNNNSTYGIGSTANLFNSILTTNNVTNYVVSASDGSIRTYQVRSFPVSGGTNLLDRTRPYLTKWQDDAGNYALFFYGTNSAANDWGHLNRINMANGNTLVFKYDFYGRIIQALTGDGRFVNYQYDTYGDLITVILPDSSQNQYQYQHYTFTTNSTTYTDSKHLISQNIKPSGRIVANYYDSLRRVAAQASTVGTNLSLYTNAYFFYTNNITSITNLMASGVTRVEDFFHNPILYYYTNNLITNVVDALGHSNLQVWFLDSQTNLPGFYPRSLQYTVDKRGLTNQFYYDSFGNVTQKVVIGDLTGEGIASQTATNAATYTANNLPSVVKDAVGNGMELSYDVTDVFRPIQVVRKSGSTPISTNLYSYTNISEISTLGTTNFAYGMRWREVAAGATNESGFNGNGFLTQTIQYPATVDDPADGDPAVIHNLSYNLRGQPYQDEVPGGKLTQLDYDAMGRTISRQIFDQNNNNVSQEFFYYNRNGELEWYDGPRSSPEDYVYYIYDGSGRPIQQINFRSQGKNDGSGVEAPAGGASYSTIFQTFDGFGNQTSVTDSRGVTATNLFDALGQVLVKQVFETNGTALKTERFAYEPGGLVTLSTNALGGVTQTLYTQTGKPRYTSGPDGTTNGWTYYLDGRAKRQYLANGSYWQSVYDDLNLLITRTFYNSSDLPLATNLSGLDRRGNVILKVDEAGSAFTNVYDGLNRIKFSAGPVVTTPGVVQQTTTNYFDAAGLAATNVNALGEKTISYFDVLGRVTDTEIRDASNHLVRATATAYSPDHQSQTTTQGTDSAAVVSTTYTDNQGQPVLSISYPSPGVMEYFLRKYDQVENLVSETHNTITNGVAKQWTVTSSSYDGLNRLISRTDRDGAVTAYAYDAASDLTNEVLPGGLIWRATYNSALQKQYDCDIGTGGSLTRSNRYAYDSTTGLLLTSTDGRGVTCTRTYDDFLRGVTNVYTGSLPEQNLTTSLAYDARGLVVNISESFASTNTGPSSSVTKTYDAYGQLLGDSVSAGTFNYATSMGRDAAGRRTSLGIGDYSYNYAWRADGLLTSVGGGSYTYDNAGHLLTRSFAPLFSSITSRDGEGRPLSASTTVNAVSALAETLAWTGDGLLASHKVQRPDFTDARSYAYANLSRRLAQEVLGLSAGTNWTNGFVYDGGIVGGAGVLTSAGQSSLTALWRGGIDVFSRIGFETNTVAEREAYGQVNGPAALGAFLDGNPTPITAIGTNALQWRGELELLPGAHQLVVEAVHPSGLYAAWATNTFTNNAADQAQEFYSADGELTNRVWLNAAGHTNRAQSLSWDAKGRLHSLTDVDNTTSGYSWTAVYDGLGRRLQTTTVLVTNGVSVSALPKAIHQYFDPAVEFLELGETDNGVTTWKIYGPDANGVYGGMNGVGGLAAVAVGGQAPAPVVSDIRGNIYATYSVPQASLVWNPARPSGFGGVPGYRVLPLGQGMEVAAASAWRGKWSDISGLYWLGARYYDPIAGRFLGADPLGHEADPSLYTFCGGDPINRFDPDGRFGKGFDAGQNSATVPPNASSAFMNGYMAGGVTSAFGEGANEGASIVNDKLTLGQIDSLHSYTSTLQGTEYDRSRFFATAGTLSLGLATGGAAVDSSPFLFNTAIKASMSSWTPVVVGGAVSGFDAYDSGGSAQDVAVSTLMGAASTYASSPFAFWGNNAPSPPSTGVQANKAAGDAWENELLNNILPQTQNDLQPQITIKSSGPSGLKIRMDIVGTDAQTGQIALTDGKASDTAPLTAHQEVVYPELPLYGGIVRGKGKPPYVGGTVIPPTAVNVIRKP